MFHLIASTVVILGLVLGIVLLTFRKLILNRKLKDRTNGLICCGLFHPYCNAGGGGERVLWCAVRALQAKYDNIEIVIYTGDEEYSPSAIIDNAQGVFNVSVEKENIKFIYLRKRRLVEPRNYPCLTLLGQSLGSLFLGFEALFKHPPDVFIDTTGYTFILPLFRFLGSCQVGCYIHYPIISKDMVTRIRNRTLSHNNQHYVVRNPFVTWLKLTYYHIFTMLYSWAGRSAHTVMVNSSWTENHILDLWKEPFKTHRVYPPCEVSHLRTLPRNKSSSRIAILSVGQFREEKDHPKQLQVMYELRTMLTNDEDLWNKIRLVVVGSCRNEEDYERLNNMKDLAKHLSLEEYVDFKVNIPYEELLGYYQSSKIGIHTMWNEHFGISVVECMAAGLIMVAHKSGGPLLDIIETSEGSQTGYLAESPADYANCILKILYNTKAENDKISHAARSSVERFSEKEFEVNFLRAVSPLFNRIS